MASWVSPRLIAAETGADWVAAAKYEASMIGCQAKLDHLWFLKSYFAESFGQYVGRDWSRSLIISTVSLDSLVLANCWKTLMITTHLLAHFDLKKKKKKKHSQRHSYFRRSAFLTTSVHSQKYVPTSSCICRSSSAQIPSLSFKITSLRYLIPPGKASIQRAVR